MLQRKQNNLPGTEESLSGVGSLSGVEVDQGERETLEMLIKEILLYLPMDEESDEELYRSNVPGEEGQFTLNLYGYEMRSLRRFLQKIRFGSAQ